MLQPSRKRSPHGQPQEHVVFVPDSLTLEHCITSLLSLHRVRVTEVVSPVRFVRSVRRLAVEGGRDQAGLLVRAWGISAFEFRYSLHSTTSPKR